MSRPTPPTLTVHYDGSTRTFTAGNDVIVGRDRRADICIAHPLVSHAHLVLRFDQGRWVAIDDGSLNGMFVGGWRVPAVDIQDGMQINLANSDGPRLTFEVGNHHGSAGMTPTTSRPQSTDHSGSQPRYPSGLQSDHLPNPWTYHSNPSESVRRAPITQAISASAPEPATSMIPTAAPRSNEDNLATSMLKILRPGRSADVPPDSVKIGRAPDNDIVIPDVLVSRHHATLVPHTGWSEIRDARSSNGTFVNGARVEAAALRDGDVVTIGNVDLVFSGGTWRAAPRPRHAPAV